MLGSAILKFFKFYKKEINLIIPKKFELNNKFEFINSLENSDYVINCAGAIPQRIPNLKDFNDKLDYYEINYLIPEVLLENNFKVIQPCTDCVFKGDPKYAPYSLNSNYDCDDLYGKSKAELYSRKIYKRNISSIKVIRSSIVGIDKFHKSLYSWSLNQAKSSKTIEGYTNHFWNGITTLKWAELCLDVINNFNSYPPISVFGTNNISKYELIKKILITNNLSPDKYLKPIKAKNTIDKTLNVKENNFGDIFDLLKDLKEFNEIK